MKIAVGIATHNRRDILAKTLQVLCTQERLPDRVILCPSSPNDVQLGTLSGLPVPIDIVAGRIGLTSQRNAILQASEAFDLLIFFDDDFVPAKNYVANVEKLFVSRSEVVLATGTLLADGIHGPGLTIADALAYFHNSPSSAGTSEQICYGGYGCNMAVRLSVVREHRLFFDENLPLYGWQEDIDFSRQLAAYGLIVKSGTLIGVHLGAKVGRTNGLKVGYSQIANPIYLIRKGTMSPAFGSRTMVRNVLANLVRSIVRPEPYFDRPGRLQGNVLALLDVVRGKLSPGRITQLQ